MILIRGELGNPEGKVTAYDNMLYVKIIQRELLSGRDLPMYVLARNNDKVSPVYGLMVNIEMRVGGKYEIISASQ